MLNSEVEDAVKDVFPVHPTRVLVRLQASVYVRKALVVERVCLVRVGATYWVRCVIEACVVLTFVVEGGSVVL